MSERELVLDVLRCSVWGETEAGDAALWNAVITFQGVPFYTASGLPFSYTLKKTGGGELLISRKEGSKTLTRSSILYAFHVVREAYQKQAVDVADGGSGNRRDEKQQTGYMECGGKMTQEAAEPVCDDRSESSGRRRRKRSMTVEAWMAMQGEKLIRSAGDPDGQLPAYDGPKAIGQIFGISYIYSMFFRFGLIRVPERVAEKMCGGDMAC